MIRKELERLPWTKINDYLLDIGSARTKRQLLERAVAGLGRLIPYDASAGVFDAERRCLLGDGLSECTRRAYNEYYRTVRLPFCRSRAPWGLPEPRRYSHKELSVYSTYAQSEFYTDFARPNGLAYAIKSLAPGSQLALSPNRSRWGPAFSSAEQAILDVITAHLNNFYAIFIKLESSSLRFPECGEIRQRFPRLSHRECEVAQLLCQGLSASEIASRLFLSSRTVEVHIAHLYAKLEVRSRRGAVSRLSEACEG